MAAIQFLRKCNDISRMDLEIVLSNAKLEPALYEQYIPFLRFIIRVVTRLSKLDLQVIENFNLQSLESTVDNWGGLLIEFRDGISGRIAFNTNLLKRIVDSIRTFIDDRDDWYLKFLFTEDYNNKTIDELIVTLQNEKDKIYVASARIAELLQKAEEQVRIINENATKNEVTAQNIKFIKAANEYQKYANRWLWTTAIILTLTILAIVYSEFIFGFSDKMDLNETLRKVSSKIFTLILLVSGTIWTGRIYKANRNLSIIYKHKADALSTFQVFVENAVDTQTKDFVLQETTRTIFNLPSTGLVEKENLPIENGSKIFEIVKNIRP